MEQAEPFEVRYSIPKMLGWSAFAAGLATLSYFAAGSSNALYALGGIAGVAFFGFALCVFLTKLFDRRVQLRIADNALFLRPHSDKSISLRAIKNFRIDGNRLKLIFYKPTKYPIEQPLRRVIYQINGSQAREFLGDAWVWTSQYECTLGQIFDAINAHIELTDFEKDLLSRMATPGGHGA